jgi:hypothetical protein
MSNENFSERNESIEHEKEKNLTNSRINRSFIDNILQSKDEHAIKKLFEEYFYLHTKKTDRDQITWNELRFIINEILQRNTDDLVLNEATNIFYQMYQLQYPTSIIKQEKQLFLKKTKSEQELLPKSKNNKKIRNE